MSKSVYSDGDQGVRLIVKEDKHRFTPVHPARSPVHVLYGGAHLFHADAPAKLGTIALRSLHTYAPNFLEFAAAMKLNGRSALPGNSDAVKSLGERLAKDPEQVKREYYAAWFAWSVYNRTLAKLETEPIEDFRIDFEDGYGFRPDEEEDSHARASAEELSRAAAAGSVTLFSGIRIKGLGPETLARGTRTLELFFERFLEYSGGRLPDNFVVTLPKVRYRKEVKELSRLLKRTEKRYKLRKGSIGIELMVETPEALFDKKGRIALPGLVKAGDGRCRSAHFGAFDYTSDLGIAAAYQSIHHGACDLARQMMLVTLVPMGIRVSDSVTTELPLPPHKGDGLSSDHDAENKRTVHAAWRAHYANVTRSMSDGFFQSWDLHPAQLPARYAAVYSFFLESMDSQAERLRAFVEKATKATTTGSTFDDAASARGLMNFFSQGLSCGAFTETEVFESTGLTAAEIRSNSFSGIMENRSD